MQLVGFERGRRARAASGEPGLPRPERRLRGAGALLLAGLLLVQPRLASAAEGSGAPPAEDRADEPGAEADTVLRGEYRERYEAERLKPWGLFVLELTVGFGAGAFRTGDTGWGVVGIASRVAGGTGLGLVIAGQEPGPGVNEAMRIPGFVALGLGIAGCWATRIAVPMKAKAYNRRLKRELRREQERAGQDAARAPRPSAAETEAAGSSQPTERVRRRLARPPAMEPPAQTRLPLFAWTF